MAFERGVPGARDPWPWSLREEPEIPTLPICHVILPCRCATVTLRPPVCKRGRPPLHSRCSCSWRYGPSFGKKPAFISISRPPDPVSLTSQPQGSKSA